MNDLRELYEEVILEHNRNPRNFGHPDGSTACAQGSNPLCGDQIQVYLTVHEGVITDVGFEGEGCAISTASASLMTEAVKGKPIAVAQALFGRMRELLTGPDPSIEGIGKLEVLAGVRDFPMRVKCASLPWHTLKAALEGEGSAVSTE